MPSENKLVGEMIRSRSSSPVSAGTTATPSVDGSTSAGTKNGVQTPTPGIKRTPRMSSRKSTAKNKELLKRELNPTYLDAEDDEERGPATNIDASSPSRTPSITPPKEKRKRNIITIPPVAPKEQNGRFNITLITDKEKRKSFIEPKLAEPVPGVTGLPLDSFPSQKIKKESLWPKIHKNKRKSLGKPQTEQSSSSRPESVTSELSLANSENSSREQSVLEADDVHLLYNKSLKTEISEDLTSMSHIREPPKKPAAKRGRPPSSKKKLMNGNKDTTKPTPLSPSLLKSPKKNKLIKFSSPKKRENPFGFGAPADLTGQPRQTADNGDNLTKDNDDFCSACGEPGIFLCCDSCPRSFHFACCDPPYDENSLPEDSWYCRECSVRSYPPKVWDVGMFSKLMNQQEKRNPIQFKLPKKVREAFKGVHTGKFGEYEDNSEKPPKTVKAGKLEEQDPFYDKDGKPYLCYNCGESGIHGKQIANCDYCTLSWHLDCLSPPLSSMKTIGNKWKCPNHSDDLIPPQRRLKTATTLDVSMSRGFKNDGNIEIKLDEDSFYDDEDTFLEGEAVDIPTPDYFKGYNTESGVTARMSKKMMKTMLIDSVVYRIPENGVLLDFIDKIRVDREKIKADLDLYNEEVLRSLNDTDKRDGVETLLQFNERAEEKTLNLDELLKVIAEEKVTSEGDERAPKRIKLESKSETLSEEEVEDLLKIKRLMEIKGRDALLHFLTSGK